jgi:hypothetical protein
MAGVNLFSRSNVSATIQKSMGIPKNCVFISHRKSDTSAAVAIAKYLREVADVNVYIDEIDTPLKEALAKSDHEKIVEYIERGIAVCSHILTVISNNTKGSWWVPFEIGSARRANLEVAHTILEEVKNLPSYLQIATLIKDEIELKSWAKKVSTIVLKAEGSYPTPSIPGLPQVRLSNPTFEKSF